MKLLPVALLVSLSCAFAAEPVELPMDVGTLKMRDGKVYEGAKIVGNDAVGVKVMHAGGTARVPYERLPKELADRFPRDHKAAKEQLEKESRAEAAHDRAVDKALEKRPAGDGSKGGKADDEASDAPLEGLPEDKGDTAAKILALENYIRRLENGVAEARQKVDDSRRRAADAREAAVVTITRYDSSGISDIETRPNPSKLSKARFYDRRADREEAKIREANLLIESARTRIAALAK